MLDLEFLWKWASSGNGDCPALYKATRDGMDGYIVQGTVLTVDELTQVGAVGASNNSGISAAESALFVPADVIDRIRG